MKPGSNNNKNSKNHIFANKNQLHHCLTAVIEEANINAKSIRFYDTESIDPPLKALEMFFDFGKANTGNYKKVPILYQRKVIGDMLLNSGQQLTEDKVINYPQITKTMALLFKRFQNNESAYQSINERPVLIGYSQQSLKLESFIEKAASALHPVIIEGDIGNEMSAISLAIHNNGPQSNHSYTEIDCSTSNHLSFNDNLDKIWEKSKGGTLYLHEINELSLSQQSSLINQITPEVKIIVSSTRPLQPLVNRGEFYQQLYKKLDFLKIYIPPLKDRKEDIPYMVNLLLLKHRQFDTQTLSGDTLGAIYDFDWPGNFIQLERLMVKLLALANTNPINIEELLEIIPEINHQPKELRTLRKSTNHTNLVPLLVAKDYKDLSQLHKCLEKSLRYLAENYYETITLDILSSNAHVSASHLSFLFKHHLNRSFKKILAEIRIEHAKLLFIKYPYKRITDASLEVGFGDLSHFEKIFRRHTNMTPRSYKNSLKESIFLQ